MHTHTVSLSLSLSSVLIPLYHYRKSYVFSQKYSNERVRNYWPTTANIQLCTTAFWLSQRKYRSRYTGMPFFSFQCAKQIPPSSSGLSLSAVRRKKSWEGQHSPPTALLPCLARPWIWGASHRGWNSLLSRGCCDLHTPDIGPVEETEAQLCTGEECHL